MLQKEFIQKMQEWRLRVRKHGHIKRALFKQYNDHWSIRKLNEGDNRNHEWKLKGKEMNREVKETEILNVNYIREFEFTCDIFTCIVHVQ